MAHGLEHVRKDLLGQTDQSPPAYYVPQEEPKDKLFARIIRKALVRESFMRSFLVVFF